MIKMKRFTSYLIIIIILTFVFCIPAGLAEEGLPELKVVDTSLSSQNTLNVFFNVLDENDQQIDIAYNDLDITIKDDKDETLEFSTEGLGNYDNYGTTYVLAVDTSKSNKKHEAMTASMNTLISDMKAADRACIITFGDDVTVLQEFTNDKDLLKTVVDGIDFNKTWTKLYSGIATAMTYTATHSTTLPSKKALILYSDGFNYDDGGKVSADSLIDRIENKPRSLPIYGLQFDPRGDEENKQNIKELREIIDASKGELVTLAGSSVSDCYNKIANLIDSLYYLDLQTNAKAGKYTITIKTNYHSTWLEDSFDFVTNRDIHTEKIAAIATEPSAEPTVTVAPIPSTTPASTTDDKVFGLESKELLIIVIACSAVVCILIIFIIIKSVKNKKSTTVSIGQQVGKTFYLKPFKTDDCEGVSVHIHQQVVIGSSKKCDIIYKAPLVKPQHFVLEYKDDHLFIFSAHMDNDTYVNGYMLDSKRELRNNDIIAFGSVEIEIVF